MSRNYQLTLTEVISNMFETFFSTEYIGENAIWVQFLGTLQFSISLIQPVETLIRNV